MPLEGEYVVEEEKPLPTDFHGEPVPEDEDDDDALFEIAAGLRPKQKRDSIAKPPEEELLVGDDEIELDFCKILSVPYNSKKVISLPISEIC